MLPRPLHKLVTLPHIEHTNQVHLCDRLHSPLKITGVEGEERIIKKYILILIYIALNNYQIIL